MNKTNMVIAVFATVLVLALAAMYSPVYSAPTSRETFAQKEIGMAVNAGGMGPYDNVSVPGASPARRREFTPS